MWLEEHIPAGLKEYKDFCGFEESPDWKTLEGVYTEMLPKLTKLYCVFG
ncbi:hypothetical protein [Uliginosibacterium gangwonense]|nr:hypothetical protein [Uliginosibacterium gangwonense]